MSTNLPTSTQDEIRNIYDQLDPARQERLASYAARLLLDQDRDAAWTGSIGDVLRAAREGLGFTTTELAKASGIRRPSIEAIERGRGTTADERHHISAGLARLVTIQHEATA